MSKVAKIIVLDTSSNILYFIDNVKYLDNDIIYKLNIFYNSHIFSWADPLYSRGDLLSYYMVDKFY